MEEVARLTRANAAAIKSMGRLMFAAIAASVAVLVAVVVFGVATIGQLNEQRADNCAYVEAAFEAYTDALGAQLGADAGAVENFKSTYRSRLERCN